MHNAFRIRDVEYNVELARTASGYRLYLGVQRIPVALNTGTGGTQTVYLNGEPCEIVAAVHGDTLYLHVDGETHAVHYLHPLDRLAAASGGSAEDQILAPMPGTVIAVAVAVGASVMRGDTLMVIESMKMETTLAAPRDGVVAELLVAVGETFNRDALLIAMQPEDAA